MPSSTKIQIPFSHLEVEEGEGRVEDDLQDGVDGDEDGAVLGAAIGQLVPEQDHGDAARQSHQDHPRPVVRQVRQRRPRKRHLRTHESTVKPL